MKFKKIYIEITNICNLNCSFCSKNNHDKHEMTVDEFQIVIDKIANYTESIYLHVKGEPLLHSQLDKILNILDKYSINVCITTNGTLLKERKELLLKHNIKQINVSLHSENNKKRYYEDIIDTCNELKEKTTIIYRLWINEKESIIYHILSENYHIDIDYLKNNKNIKLIDNIYLDKDKEFSWPEINDSIHNYGTCKGTRSHIAILSNGVVVPCCLDTSGVMNLGNIYYESLNDILNSDLFKMIHEGFQNNKIYHPLCQSCFYRERFNK